MTSVKQARRASQTEIRIREFLKTRSRVRQSAGSTLVRLNDWMTKIVSGPAGEGLDLISARAGLKPRSELVEIIAECLIDEVDPVERNLLSKSIQETILYCISLKTDISYAQLVDKMLKYIGRHKTGSINERFLSLYFFNYVWFRTGESFRAVAGSSDSFEREMAGVERICRHVVAAAWAPFQETHRVLNRAAATELVRRIEHRLRGPAPR
jgi:hypothetical protein